MPIAIECPKCQRRMRVPDSAAGKKVKCPKCQAPISVTAPAKEETKEETYVLKTEEGEQFGPISKSELDEWHQEGRITEDCQLLRTGSEQWQWATDLYPDLEGDEEPPAAEGEEQPLAEPPAIGASQPAETEADEPTEEESEVPPADTTPQEKPAKKAKKEAAQPSKSPGQDSFSKVAIWVIALLVANLFFTLMSFVFLLILQFRS